MRGPLRLAAIAGLVAAAFFLVWWDQRAGAPTETAAQPPKADRQRAGPQLGSGFDFYLLSLSWSPSYCEAEGQEANRQQCGSDRPYGFVVHGLWPQFEQGFPENCATGEPDLASQTVRRFYELMPSAGLIRHQWRKHGTCSGLDQRDYFATLRAAHDKVAVPEEFRSLDAYRTVAPGAVEDAFRRANPMLPAQGITIACDERYLREVRICLTKELAFRPCPAIDRRSCRSTAAIMPPVRGR
ncbi:ribonuclease [Mesorhizobium sp. L-8-10]|uniref:ribonuclease T2 family protein n=1 Tax=Mesorhizobium sp. L-8-10 TaxID=2744523 RepID=UPI0019283977|nr:ribonuclease T2 [Mesorhizobium sp. L-8-10]BCH33773.1 ribonuclease [Mesorhizobium sp. L-8-10]